MTTELDQHVTDELPAFVLDALTASDTSRVAEHLAVCPECQAELLRLQQVVEELPLAVQQALPTEDVKHRLFSRIEQKAQPKVIPQLTFWQSLRRSLRVSLPVIGLALILLLLFGNALLVRQLNIANQAATSAVKVVKLANTEFSPGAVGTLVMNPNARSGTLIVYDLLSLDPNQQYQVWLIKGSVHTSAGVFSVDPNGYASQEILAPQPLSYYDAIGISVEPAGGSNAPTGVSVLRAELTK